MRRALTVLSLLVLLVGGASTALAPAASANIPTACEIIGNGVPPVEDDCKATTDFVDETVERQADNVFWVFCTVFPEYPACQ